MNGAWQSMERISVPLTSILHFASTLIFLKYHLHPISSLFQKSSTITTRMENKVQISWPAIQGLPQPLSSLSPTSCLHKHLIMGRSIYCSGNILTPSIFPAFTVAIYIIYRSTFLQSLLPGNLILALRHSSMKPS